MTIDINELRKGGADCYWPTPEMLHALIDGANQYDSWNEGYRSMLTVTPEANQ